MLIVATILELMPNGLAQVRAQRVTLERIVSSEPTYI